MLAVRLARGLRPGNPVRPLKEKKGPSDAIRYELIDFYTYGVSATYIRLNLGFEFFYSKNGLNLVVDPSGKLLNRRKVCSRKDVIANPRVTKFKHLARRARSSHQAQLRELKNELSGLLKDVDSESEDEDEGNESDEDDSEALSSLADHDKVASSSCSVATPPLHIPSLSGEMQQVLAKLQKASRREQPDLEAAAERQASEPVAPETKKKPKKVKGQIEEKLFPEKDSCPNHMRVSLWAKDDVTGPEGDEAEQSSKKKPPKKSKKKQQKNKEIKKPNKEIEKENGGSNNGNAEEPHAITRMKKNMAPDCLYVPGSYKEARLRYINRKREKGWSWKEACAKWNGSAIRASWLEGLSTNELKRRRFI
ncbi:unnamed protein product [Symbiodinium sp. CCMP2592]|nr:unnamed protein product [Symbiodinium sp. CCMP2592]